MLHAHLRFAFCEHVLHFPPKNHVCDICWQTLMIVRGLQESAVLTPIVPTLLDRTSAPA